MRRKMSANIVSWALVITIVVSLLAIGILMLFLVMSQPQRLGAVPGSVTMEQVSFANNKTGVVLHRAPMNLLGQVQGVGVRYDWQSKKFYVDAYAIFWHPLAGFSTLGDWPIIIDTSELAPGQYEVLYWTSDKRYTSAGTFKVTRERSGNGSSTR